MSQQQQQQVPMDIEQNRLVENMAIAKGDLVSIQKLVLNESTALDKWGQVVDDIIQLEADVKKIKTLLKECEFGEAILLTLTTWNDYEGKRADLLAVLKSHLLNTLATKIKNLGVLPDQPTQWHGIR